MQNQNHADATPGDIRWARTGKRLILCFDGTGNAFQGDTSDTNIVKLYQKFDRCNPLQMHYYQPGIGTYPLNGAHVNVTPLRRLFRSISQTLDLCLARTFDSHVMSGYRFLMRYYQPGDRIYIFGFSRGAFTARFLARMINKIGLLSMGNEEMVQFAYRTYQEYEKALCVEAGPVRTVQELREEERKALDEGEDPPALTDLECRALYIQNFKDTFCRHDYLGSYTAASRNRSTATTSPATTNADESITIHFLGLFDCVGSVEVFDLLPFTKTMLPPRGAPTAKHIRHAVSIDERRVKYRPSLLVQELADDKVSNVTSADLAEDMKEVWFPGGHSDVGGGFYAPPRPRPQPQAQGRAKGVKTSWWQSMKEFFNGQTVTPTANEEHDNFQLSDIPLKWMLDEIDAVDASLPPEDQLRWNTHKATFTRNFALRRDAAVRAVAHDTMRIGGGGSWAMALVWWVLDVLPFVYRWELSPTTSRWEYVWMPVNAGRARDIPSSAVFHASVVERLGLKRRGEVEWMPKNEVWYHCGDGERGRREGRKEWRRLWEVQCEERETGETVAVMPTSGSESETGSSRSSVPKFVVKDRGPKHTDDTYVLAL